MKDEEMAEEYFNSECLHSYADTEEELKEDVVSAFLAGLKAGRPQWHKVADGDLPKRTGDYITNIGVLTYDHYGNNIYKWHIPFCEACDYGGEVDDDEVIAWCEIPTFDKE